MILCGTTGRILANKYVQILPVALRVSIHIHMVTTFQRVASHNRWGIKSIAKGDDRAGTKLQAGSAIAQGLCSPDLVCCFWK